MMISYGLYYFIKWQFSCRNLAAHLSVTNKPNSITPDKLGTQHEYLVYTFILGAYFPLTPDLRWPRFCSAIAVTILACVHSTFDFQVAFSLVSSLNVFSAANASPSLFVFLKALRSFNFSEKFIHFVPGLFVDPLLYGKQ